MFIYSKIKKMKKQNIKLFAKSANITNIINKFLQSSHKYEIIFPVGLHFTVGDYSFDFIEIRK